MVDPTTLHRQMARLTVACLCPAPCPCRQHGLRPASAGRSPDRCSARRTPGTRHTAVESTI